MEVFVANIADQTTDSTLKRFFRKKFKELGVEIFDFRKLKSRGCAIFTIADVVKGNRFIGRFSPPNYPWLDNRPLRISRGKNTPDPYLIRALEKRARELNSSELSQEPKADRQSFRLARFSCGFWFYESDYLVYCREWSLNTTNAIKVLVLGDKELTVSIRKDESPGKVSFVRLHIQYSTIESITCGDHGALTLTLDRSPNVYHVSIVNSRPQSIRCQGMDPEHIPLIGYCWVYRLHVLDLARLTGELEGLKSVPSLHFVSTVEKGAEISMFHEIRITQNLIHFNPKFDFALKFQILRLVSNCYLVPSVVNRLLPVLERIAAEHGCAKCSSAVKKLFNELPFAGPDVNASEFSIERLEAVLEDALERVTSGPQSRLSSYEHLLLVHRVSVTPAGIYLEGPDVECKNRILRKYSKHASEHFLRVSFMEEDGTSIRYDRTGSLSLIHDGFRDFLNKPLRIAGKDFQFLGFSNSSLREQSCWYMAPFTLNDQVLCAKDVIAKLGRFEEIRSPAKCAARIGQAFTDTPQGVIAIDEENVVEMADIERNGRIFSDGCGTISQKLIEKIWEKYPFGPKPTLFQIRHAGCKGMISLDSRLRGELMVYRPSMDKFVSPHTDLEICGSNRRSLPCYLNHQLIKILEDLGVGVEPLMKLQRDAVLRLRRTTQHPVNASSFLEREGVGRATNLPWLVLRLYRLGIAVLQDGFIRRCLEHTVLGQLRQIKHRGRILVEEGVTLYGIMDETRTLRENEIYCRRDGRTITGPVTITRSPALHPGDIQKVQAVEVQSSCPLKKLNNCVVFSQFGVRDLPSQLSGGDLDGDQFAIIMEKSLQPTITYDAADYPRVLPKTIDRPVTLADITDHFVTFMGNDQLGRIATMHKQVADLERDGTLSENSKILAGLHSTSVDFPKTGIAVDMNQCPRIKPWKPDYMAPSPRVRIDGSSRVDIVDEPLDLSDDEEETLDDFRHPDKGRKRTRYYESHKALGELYRAIDEKAFLTDLKSMSKPVRRQCDPIMQKLWDHVEKHTVGIQWNHLITWAQDVQQEYDELMEEMCTSYALSRRHPLTEVEVFTGSVLGNEDGSLPSRRMRETAKTMRDRFEEGVSAIVDQILLNSASEEDGEDEGGKEHKEDDEEKPQDRALERALACFYVSLMDKNESLKDESNYISFRYVAGMLCLREVEVFARSLESIDKDMAALGFAN